MDLARLVIQLVIAIVCGMIGNMLIPRQIPGKFLGLIVIGFVGVWLGESVYRMLRTSYGLNYDFLKWNVEGVPIIPASIGCAVVIYLVTTFLKWGRYSQ